MGKEVINQYNVSNPEGLEKILNSVVKEIDLVRTLVNELKTDLTAHTHTVEAHSHGVTTTVSGILAELKTDFNAHTHDVGGVTSSGISVTITEDVESDSITSGDSAVITSGAGATISSTSITEYTTRGR